MGVFFTPSVGAFRFAFVHLFVLLFLFKAQTRLSSLVFFSAWKLFIRFGRFLDL